MYFPGLLLALLVVIAAVLAHRRLRYPSEPEPRLSDDMIRQIEQQGYIELDEPLDLKRIRAEEEEFWRETWDEPEEL